MIFNENEQSIFDSLTRQEFFHCLDFSEVVLITSIYDGFDVCGLARKLGVTERMIYYKLRIISRKFKLFISL